MSGPSNKVVAEHSRAQLDHEVWQALPYPFEAYAASSCGRIRSDVTGELVATPKGEKYLICGLRRSPDRKVVSRRVHILVALAFLGPKPTPEHEVNHKNGDKLDNRVENLEYLTSDENEHHAATNALKAWGESSARSKLTEDQVREIRRGGKVDREFAQMFGVSKSAILSVRRGQTWRHLDQAEPDDRPSLAERVTDYIVDHPAGRATKLMRELCAEIERLRTSLSDGQVTE
jgi:hypothetical protein